MTEGLLRLQTQITTSLVQNSSGRDEQIWSETDSADPNRSGQGVLIGVWDIMQIVKKRVIWRVAVSPFDFDCLETI